MKADTQKQTSARTFAALEDREFKWIWVAASFSHMGTVVQITSAAWLMTTITDSPFLISMVQSCAYLPAVIFSLIAGASADLFDKRVQMILSVALRVVAVFILAALVVLQSVKPWSLLMLTALIGVGAAFYNPSWQASLRQIVTRENLISAISLNNLSFNTARCVGPALGSEIIILIGAGAALFISGATFILLFVALLLFSRPKPVAAENRKSHVFGAISEGVIYAGQSPKVCAILIKALLFSVCGSVLLALPPVIALDLGGGARAFGLLVTSFGAGAVIGALVITRLIERISSDMLVVTCSLLVAGSIFAIALSDSLILACAVIWLGGAGWVNVVSTLQRSIQIACPHGVVGRAISLLGTVYSLGIASGSALWGFVAEQYNLTTSLMMAAGILAMLTWLGKSRRIDADPETELK